MVLTYISRGEYISGLRSLKCCWTKVKLSLLFPSPVRGLDLRVYLEESDGSFPQCESNFPNELFQKSLRRRIYSSMSTVRLECKNLPSHKRSFKRKRKAVRRATKFIVKSEEPYDVDISGLKLLTLKQRRFLFDEIFLFKALNGYMDGLNFWIFIVKRTGTQKGDMPLGSLISKRRSTACIGIVCGRHIAHVWHSRTHCSCDKAFLH